MIFGNGLIDARQYDQQSRLIDQHLTNEDTIVYDYHFNSNLETKTTDAGTVLNAIPMMA